MALAARVQLTDEHFVRFTRATVADLRAAYARYPGAGNWLPAPHVPSTSTDVQPEAPGSPYSQ
jgi:hypothetical protein